MLQVLDPHTLDARPSALFLSRVQQWVFRGRPRAFAAPPGPEFPLTCVVGGRARSQRVQVPLSGPRVERDVRHAGHVVRIALDKLCLVSAVDGPAAVRSDSGAKIRLAYI